MNTIIAYQTNFQSLLWREPLGVFAYMEEYFIAKWAIKLK